MSEYMYIGIFQILIFCLAFIVSLFFLHHYIYKFTFASCKWISAQKNLKGKTQGC
jgi:hypothetical protein